MNSSHADASQPRRAALMAHALSPQDQAWLLAALPVDRRDVLHALLVELRELGIPTDATLLDGLEPPAMRAAPEVAPHGPDLLELLSRGQVRALAKVLQREGPIVAAFLLAMRRWTWRSDLLAALDGDFVHAVEAAAVPAPVAALQEALCAALLQQMEAAMPRQRGFSARGLWQRAGRAVRRAGAIA